MQNSAKLNQIFSICQKSFADQALLMRWECVLQGQGQYDLKNPLTQNTLTAFRMSMTNFVNFRQLFFVRSQKLLYG